MPYTLLDGVPFYTKEEIDDEFSEGAVGDERTRAEAAEQANAAAIEAEVTRATESENALQSQLQDVENLAEQTSVHLAGETNRATTAEQVNATAIATERSRAIAAEGQIATDIITEAARATAAEQTIQNNVDAINAKIPVAASTQNQLADKAYVEDSIRVADASFRGSYATVSAIPTVYTDYPADSSGNKKPNANDYIYVRDASGYQSETLTGCWKFKYTGDWDTDGVAGWLPEYAVSDSVFSQAQINALNSGIDSTKVAQIATNTQDIDAIEALIPAEASAQNQLADKAYADEKVAKTNTTNKVYGTDSNGVQTLYALEDLQDVFFIEVTIAVGSGSGGITYTITPITARVDIEAALLANKFPVIKAKVGPYNAIHYFMPTYISAANSRFTLYGTYLFNEGEIDINSTIYVYNWTTYTFKESFLQPKLTAGYGIDITGNTISAKVDTCLVEGSLPGTFSIDKNTIKTAINDGKPFLVIEKRFSNRAVYPGTVYIPFISGDSLYIAGIRAISERIQAAGYNGVIGSSINLVRFDSPNSRSYDLYFNDFVNFSGSSASFAIKGKVTIEVDNQNYSPTINISDGTSGADLCEVTILGSEGNNNITVNYPDTTGVTKTIVFKKNKNHIRLIKATTHSFICEHTIPLTGTDDNGNQFSYDVVVRD